MVILIAENTVRLLSDSSFLFMLIHQQKCVHYMLLAAISTHQKSLCPQLKPNMCTPNMNT